MAEFVNLHVHDTYGSLLDSILRPEDIAKFAHDHGQPAIAVTNHGYMSSFVDFHKACLKYGVKPIHGCEIYECDNDQWRSDTKDYKQPRYHLVLLAKNKTGLQNLFKIVSFGCTEGFYKKPRISVERIKENDWGEGIICLTACQAGRISRLLTSDNITEAKSFYYLFKKTFDDVYLEIQAHGTPEQASCNRLIQNFASLVDGKCVVTTDAHMLSPDQADSHSIFVEIGEGREVGEAYTDCYLQTGNNVFDSLTKNFMSLNCGEINQAIENTVSIANQIENIDIGITSKAIMPKVSVEGDFDSHEQYLRHLVYSTFDEKFKHMSEAERIKRRERIEEELPVLYALEYTDYFIMLYMLIDAFRKAGIPLGYARGSAAGSLCLYMLNVTQIDSVRWKLDFSRFANLGRKSMADCDIDISKRRRREAVDIAAQLFGKENVAPICTFNTLSTKVAIRDIGKVLNEKEDSPYFGQIPYSLRDEVAKMIPTIKTLNDLGEEEEKDVLLRDILLKNDKLQEVYTRFPLWFKHIMVLEGLPKSMGRHAAGTLITPKPVVSYCPVCHDKDGNVMVQLEMHAAMDDLGLTKMDFLGLKTLDVVDDALHSANLTWDDVNIDHLNLDDQAVYSQVYQPGNTIGIFQMESYEARRMCIDSKADDVENIVVVNAANRPGTKDSFPEYCRNKLYPEQETPIHPDLSKMFKASHGILLYQEQALQVFRYAGFPEEEVDNARRAIGKKKEDVMKALEVDLRKGLIAKGWSDEQCSAIWDLLLKQASYSFNRSHAVAYGLLSYLTAYLKVHYPVEFISACLTNDSDNVSKISVFINEAKRIGIKVLPPHINKSGKYFTPIAENNEILFGLLAVKGIGESVVNQIIENRPYKNLKDFVSKIKGKTAVVQLIKAGAIPGKNKMQTLQRYAEMCYVPTVYKEVSTLPTKAKLLLDWDINQDDYKEGKKVNKERVLNEYNLRRLKAHEEKESKRRNEYMMGFYDDYCQFEFLWEFETLSMFVTHDPLCEANQYITTPWNKISSGEVGIVVCVVTDIENKKDKNGNVFAYIDLYTPYGIIESTCWSSQMKEYGHLIKKGKCLAIKGRKAEGEHLFVEAIKPYEQWLHDRQIKLPH